MRLGLRPIVSRKDESPPTNIHVEGLSPVSCQRGGRGTGLHSAATTRPHSTKVLWRGDNVYVILTLARDTGGAHPAKHAHLYHRKGEWHDRLHSNLPYA